MTVEHFSYHKNNSSFDLNLKHSTNASEKTKEQKNSKKRNLNDNGNLYSDNEIKDNTIGNDDKCNNKLNYRGKQRISNSINVAHISSEANNLSFNSSVDSIESIDTVDSVQSFESNSSRFEVQHYVTRIKNFFKGKDIGYMNLVSENESLSHSSSSTDLKSSLRPREKLRNLDRLTRIMCDEANRSVIKGVLILEKPIEREKLELIFEEKIVKKFRRFRSKLVRRNFVELMPEEVNIKNHVHELYLEDDFNSENHLRETLSEHVNKPFHPNRSPWEIYIVHNYVGGYVLMIRIHHAIGDGSALSMIFNELCDQEIKFPQCEPPKLSFWQKVGMFIVLVLLQFVNLIRVIWKSIYMIFGKSDPESPIKIPIHEMASSKKICWTRPFKLDETKNIGKPFNATLNDIMLSVIAGGLDRYSVKKTKSGPLIRDIRCIHPINTRTSPVIKNPGNDAAFLFALLPLGVEDPKMRLLEIKRRMDHLKSINEKTYAKFLIGLLNLIPGRMLKPAMDWMTSKVTVAVSNVRGPDFPLSIEGNQIKDCIGLLPSMHGIGVSCCIFSYNGTLRLGLTTDATLTDNPQEEIISAMEEEYDNMLKLLVNFN